MKIALHSLLITACLFWQIPTFTAEDGGLDLYLVISVKIAGEHKVKNKDDFAFRTFLAPGKVTGQEIINFLQETVSKKVVGIGAYDEDVPHITSIKDIETPNENENTEMDDVAQKLPFFYLQKDDLNKPLSQVLPKGVVKCSSKKMLQALFDILQENQQAGTLQETLRQSEEAGHSVLCPYKGSFKFTSIKNILPLISDIESTNDAGISTFTTVAVAGSIAASLGAGMLVQEKNNEQDPLDQLLEKKRQRKKQNFRLRKKK